MPARRFMPPEKVPSLRFETSDRGNEVEDLGDALAVLPGCPRCSSARRCNRGTGVRSGWGRDRTLGGDSPRPP